MCERVGVTEFKTATFNGFKTPPFSVDTGLLIILIKKSED